MGGWKNEREQKYVHREWEKGGLKSMNKLIDLVK